MGGENGGGGVAKEVGGWYKAMAVKSYCTSYDAPHHPTQDQRRKQKEIESVGTE